MSGKQFQVTRRNFLQGSLAITGAAVLGQSMVFANANRLTAKAATDSAEKWIKGFCGSCIWTNCGIEVKVVNGIAVEIRGNKDHPSNKGTLCPRGAAALMNLYNPYRLKAPMRRTNPEKGLDVDPGWVEISWEEAMGEATEKIRAAIEEDPRKIWAVSGFASNTHEGPFNKLLGPILDTPNNTNTNGPLCEVHHAPTTFNSTFVDRIDLGYCNYLITFGRNIGVSAMFASGPGRAFADAVERGMKTVVVDPRATKEAGSGEWVPIIPATDMAFGMAMIHVILHELNRYDVDCMKNRSNAPYLIDGNGDYLRDPGTNKPLLWDLADGRAKNFDDASLQDPALEGQYNVNGQDVVPAFVKLKESCASSSPEWAEGICGVPAETIRRITTEFVDEARIGSTIEIDGEIFPYRPVAVAVGRGAANNTQGSRFYITANVINLLVGALGVPGSLISSALVSSADPEYYFEDGMMRTKMQYRPLGDAETDFGENFSIPAKDYTGQTLYAGGFFPILGYTLDAVNDPERHYLDYTMDVIIAYGTNPFINHASLDVVVEAIRKIPFVLCISYHIDEMALFSDIILPEHSHLERTQIRAAQGLQATGADIINLDGMNYKEPGIDILYNTRQYEDIALEIFYKLGLGPKTNMIYNDFNRIQDPKFALRPDKEYTYREMVDQTLKSFTNDESKGCEWFAENGFYMDNLPLRECYEYYLFKGRGRLPIYNWRGMKVGHALRKNMEKHNVELPGWEGKMEEVYREYSAVPVWYDNYLSTPSEEFDMVCINWKISPRNLGLGGQDDNVWLREVIEKLEFDDLNIQINSATAAKMGIVNGDEIIVESQHGGSVQGPVKVTDLIHPQVVGFPAQAGRYSSQLNPISKRGVNYNRLLSLDAKHVLPETGAIAISARVKIRKV